MRPQKRFNHGLGLDSTGSAREVAIGCRVGEKGTHSSRTIMLSELSTLLSVSSKDTTREEYGKLVVKENCLGKRTHATRRLTFQRLSELYGLDPTVPLFRLMRSSWNLSKEGQPLIAMLAALARDPLLRLTAPTVLETPIGTEVSRQLMADALTDSVGDRFKSATIDKIVRNAASSWTQSGHLHGHGRKIRRLVEPSPPACAFALLIGYLLGHRGQRLLESPWVHVLDIDKDALLNLASEASRLHLLDFKHAGSFVEVSFKSVLSRREEDLIHGPT